MEYDFIHRKHSDPINSGQVAITYSGNEKAANETVTKLKANGANAVAIRANILDADVGDTIVNEAVAGLKTNTIHILINNAAL